MKNPLSLLRSLGNRRLLLTTAVVLVIAALATATVLIRKRAERKGTAVASVRRQFTPRRSGGGKADTGSPVAEPGPQEPSRPDPDVVHLVGPVSQDQNLNDLPYIAPRQEADEVPLRRHPLQPGQPQGKPDPLQAVKTLLMPVNMPGTTLTFDGIDSILSGCGCLPPDSDGDVGSNNYINSVNSSIRVYDKTGNALTGPTTYNAFFAAIGPSNVCGNSQNDGDGVVFYDHIADRWVVSDFAFPAFPGAGPFYQCIGVSKTADPVAGGWWLYAVQVDPVNTNFIGDYPKFGLWPDAYYLSMNLFSGADSSFQGVRIYALNRSSMINGGSANAIGFSIGPADLGDQYSLLPATFRTGLAPPVGQPEWFMSINSSAIAGTVETQVFVRRFHVDFVTPANSFFGVGATHAPDGTITVGGFVDAFTSTTNLVPQTGTAVMLDTLGDKLMYPLAYQNLGGVESIYSAHTVNNNSGGTGPMAVQWFQFNMTGNTIPATPVQQQIFNNGNDGLFRWMPSINVDVQGNMAIGYSTSASTVNPSIRYAGRLAGDPLNTLAQGEAVMYQGTGHQTSASGRWGDYSALFVDPTDVCTFWHTGEYLSVTTSASWRQRIGLFKFPGCSGSPLPTPSATPTPSPSASPTPPIAAGPVTVTATVGTLGPTDYPTVKGAFDAINAGTHQGTINIFVLGDTSEAASAVLNASGSGAALYTSIRMQPQGPRTVSGNLAVPMIDLNGASNVTIDGLKSGGNTLVISNTNTGALANTSTIRFINGASNDTVKNSTISGSSTVAVGTAGGNILFSTTTGTGNNNNTISGNDIGPAGASLPIKCISAVGTATNGTTINTGDVIDNNNSFDFFIATANTTGIDIRTGNTNWTISNNRIYQTGARTFTTSVGLRYAGITFSGTTSAGATGNYLTISGNTIGFGASNGTGTTTITGTGSGLQNEVRGIDVQAASSGTATSIQGNTISGFDQTSARLTVTTGLSAFAGIQVSSAAGGSATGVFDIGTITGNTIGSLNGSSTIVITASSVTANTTPIFGILALSGSSNNVSNNKIGAITIQGTGTATGFRGILPGQTAATTQTINSNIIGGAVAGGAITDTLVGSYAMYGIQTATAAVSINGNTIRNLNGNSNGPALVISSGIAMSSTSTSAVSNISRNIVYDLSNNSGAVSNSIYGIDVTMSTNANVTANVVERNLVHSLSITSTDNTCQLYGIINRGAGTDTIQNNMIRLGLDGAGNSITGGFLIRGIRDSTGSTLANYYYNSVYIGGTGVVSSSNSTAFYSDVVTNVRNFQNNIFWNARSNASGTGKNYAIAVGGTAPNPAGLTSNHNDLYATGTGGFVGLFNAVDQTALSDWQTATGQDATFSMSADPKFIAPTGTDATVDLHILGTSPCINAGIPLLAVTNDFDNDARDATPDIGADQVPGPTAADGTVSGTITDANGSPVAGVTIQLNGSESRKTITDASGYYSFANIETNGLYAITPSRVNYTFSPQSRTFSSLGSHTEAWFTASANSGNYLIPLDATDYFVRQQYLDFLGREPDESGFAFWSNQISSCGSDQACVNEKRVNVSAAFFLSIEFQQTGYLVYRMNKAAYGNLPGAPVPIAMNDFLPDARRVAQGVVVNQDGWQMMLNNNQQNFAAEFVQRPRFTSFYPASLSPADLVDRLFANSEVSPTAADRDAAISEFGGVNDTADMPARASALRVIAENSTLAQQESNRAFVLMQYFGYLRRDPNSGPDADFGGYDFWLAKLNNFGGDYQQAEMVKAFLVSGEYRGRFPR